MKNIFFKPKSEVKVQSSKRTWADTKITLLSFSALSSLLISWFRNVPKSHNCAPVSPGPGCNDVCGVMTWKCYQDFYLIHAKYHIISKCPNCLKSGIDIQFPMEKVGIWIQKYCLFNINFWQFHKACHSPLEALLYI